MATINFKTDDIKWVKPEDKALRVMASLEICFDTEEATKWTEIHGLVYHQRY